MPYDLTASTAFYWADEFRFALTLTGALGCLLFASASLAQTETSKPSTSLVYIADSENQSLNWRLRELLLLGAAPAIVMFIVLIAFFTSAWLDDARKEIAASSQMLADSLGPAAE